MSPTAKSDSRTLTDRFALILGHWFGCGLSPVAPGTVGSLGALPLVYVLWPSSIGYAAVTLLVCGLGVWSAQRSADILAEKDPQSVVIDEVAGVLLAGSLVLDAPLWALALAWLGFRLLDIFKPGAIDRCQHLRPAGVGIMADDILAGLSAGILARALWLMLSR